MAATETAAGSCVTSQRLSRSTVLLALTPGSASSDLSRKATQPPHVMPVTVNCETRWPAGSALAEALAAAAELLLAAVETETETVTAGAAGAAAAPAVCAVLGVLPGR